MGILDVHYFIADVVGGLDYVDERMSGIAQRFAGCRKSEQAKFVGHFGEVVALGVEESEFTFCGKHGFVGVFHDGGQGGICHRESALAPTLELMGENTEGVGVALETYQVGPLLLGQERAEMLSGTFAEECRNGFLAGMSEGRVAEVMGKACRRGDVAEMVEVLRAVGRTGMTAA